MNRIVLVAIILAITTTSFCQSKADSDNEFDNGSKIERFHLTPEKTNDLVILGQVWGFLKYYHPAIAAGEYNWDYELFRILPKIISVGTAKERNIVLQKWTLSLGEFPTVDAAVPKSDMVKIAPDLAWINPKILGPDLVEALSLVRKAQRPGNHYYVGLVPNVGNPEFRNEKAYILMNYGDTGMRILSLYRYWNIIQYYFPYRNLIDEDWNLVLKEFIPRFANAHDELEYKLAVLSLIARVHDTHAGIWGREPALEEFKGKRFAPLELSFIENKAVVTGYLNAERGEKTGLKKGDVIESINGKSVEEIIKSKLSLTPASNYTRQLHQISEELLRSNEPVIEINYRSGRTSSTKQIDTYTTSEVNIYAKYAKKDTCFRMITADIGYIYPGSIKNAYLPVIMKAVENTRGLIVDLRCYPSEFIVFTLSDYLLAEPTSFVKFSAGSLSAPGQFDFGTELKVGRSRPDPYKGKVIIIVNELTLSQAEYTTMAFRVVPNSRVIGSTTAAADGNISRFSLPGGVPTAISGIGVYYPDGRETQRVGIVPDIEVKPTIDGIRQGKDEVLELAINLIANK